MEIRRDVNSLMEMLKRKKYLQLRKNAVEALGKIDDKRAIESLIHSLRDVFPDIREEAAESLVRIGEPSVEFLIQTLKDENENKYVSKSIS